MKLYITDLNYERFLVTILIYCNFRLKEYVYTLISILNLIRYLFCFFFFFDHLQTIHIFTKIHGFFRIIEIGYKFVRLFFKGGNDF